MTQCGGSDQAVGRRDDEPGDGVQGETLRGLLLTSFGFSQFGDKAAQAATVAYIGTGVLGLLALFGMLHAVRTPKTVAFAPPQITDRRPTKETAGV
jgi:hypothetical protein